MENRTLYSGAAVTASGAGTGVTVPPGETISVQIAVYTVSGTTPSATFKVQWSEDNSTWCDADPAEDFTAITSASKSLAKAIIPKGPFMRLAWTISGTTPSFQFKATTYGLNEPD